MKKVLTVMALVSLASCTTAPPKDQEDICEIFEEKSGWYDHARDSQRKWGSPIPVMMSFIYQESSFKARAKPPRKKILWVLPGPRPASAYGYSQATDDTWRVYKKSTGAWTADRNSFEDAIDFVGWYNDQSFRKNKIQKTDPYNLYLAYHEGQGGFAKRSFRSKGWLKDVAKKVSGRSAVYQRQLNSCEKELQKGWFWKIFT
ncbi:MAG: hypothetical protein ACJAYE_002357 [Candidatus Azotimanducaceae bacterium]|jgi:hypothetical protein